MKKQKASRFFRRGLALLAALALLCAPALAAAPRVGSVFQNTTREGCAVEDTALGRLAADAVRAGTGADFALVPADSLGANLQPGELTGEALAASFPRDDVYVTVTAPASVLAALLEEAFAHAVLDERTEDLDWAKSGAFQGYFHMSGLTVQWDPTAPALERLYSLKRDGETLDVSGGGPVTLAVPRPVLAGAYGYTALADYAGAEAGTLHALLWQYAVRCGTLEPDSRERVSAIGVRSNTLLRGISPAAVVALVALLAAFAATGLKYKKKADFER